MKNSKNTKIEKTVIATVAVVENHNSNAELIAKFKANPSQLFRAVAMKKLKMDEYNAELLTPETKAEIAKLTFNEKLIELGIKVVAAEAKADKPKVEKAPKAEKPVIETSPISDAPVGSVVRYATSKKPYIVTEETAKGKFLFSKSQKFLATKTEFPVVIVEKGTGKLPVSFQDADLNSLLVEAQADLAARTEAANTIAASKAEKLAKKEAKAVKVVAEPEQTVAAVEAAAVEATTPKKVKKAKKEKAASI